MVADGAPVLTMSLRQQVILDLVENTFYSPLNTRRALEPDGRLVIISGTKKDPWIGPLTRPVQVKLKVVVRLPGRPSRVR